MCTFRRILTVLVLAQVPSGLAAQTPVDTASAVRAAASAAVSWLAVVDSGHYARSWDEAALSFQKVMPKAGWEQNIANVREPYDPIGARRLIAERYMTDLPNAPPGTYVLLQYRASVRGGGSIVETVVPVLDGDRGWRVSGYFVRPE